MRILKCSIIRYNPTSYGIASQDVIEERLKAAGFDLSLPYTMVDDGEDIHCEQKKIEPYYMRGWDELESPQLDQERG